MMTRDEIDGLERALRYWSAEVLGLDPPALDGGPATYGGEHPGRMWWVPICGQDEAEMRRIDRAVRAIARGAGPEGLSDRERLQASFRLRLAAGFLRAATSRSPRTARGWLPRRLARMSRLELLDWLLVSAWPFLLHVADDALLWNDQAIWPPRPGGSGPGHLAGDN